MTRPAYDAGPPPPPWGWSIVADFTLSAASAGTFAMAAVARLAGGAALDWTVRAAAWLAPPLVATSLAFLVAHLGRPERFWRMAAAFNPTSPMSWGAWALSAYAALAVAFAVVTLAWPSPGIARALLAAGLPLALFVLAYKGILLHATEVAVWRRGVLLAPLLLCGGLALGAALLALWGVAARESWAVALAVPLRGLVVAQAVALALQARRLGRDAFTLVLAPWAGAYWIVGAAGAAALTFVHLGAAAVATLAGGVALRRAVLDAPRARARWA